MGAIQQVLAAIGGAGGGGGPTISTWNPSDKSAGVTLSGANLVATSSTADQAVRGTLSRTTSGTYQFEVSIISVGSGGTVQVGVGTSAMTLTAPGYSAGGLSYSSNGFTRRDGSVINIYADFTSGDVVGVQMVANVFYFYKNGVLIEALTATAGDYFPAFGCSPVFTGTCSASINTGQSAFSYPVGGASAWG